MFDRQIKCFDMARQKKKMKTSKLNIIIIYITKIKKKWLDWTSEDNN